MKRLKKFFTFILCALICLNIIGCVGAGSGSEDYEDETDADISSITIFKNDWAAFNNARTQNSPIYSKLKSAINCDIIAESGAGETWEQQLKLRQSDMDLPDLFLTEGPGSPSFFESLIGERDIIAISDWVNEDTKNDYPNLYDYLKQFEYMKKNISYSEGKMWFIPSKWENEKSLYIRQDWIDNLNEKLDEVLVSEGVISSTSEMTAELREQWQFGEPKDLIDFYRMSRAFTLYDPDNNGANDTYGYMSEANKDMDSWLYISFGTGWEQFVYDEATDSYVMSDITEEAMHATNYLNRLMAEGYMSTDSITADNGTKQSRFMQGKVGMVYAHNWLNVFVSGIMDIDKCTLEEATAKILMCDPPAGRDGAWGGAGDTGYWQGFCINARMSSARIRKCLKLYEYLCSEEGISLMQYGVKDEHYTEDEQGKKTSLLDANEQGINYGIQVYDTASMLYALTWWTSAYNATTQTNAEIIINRQQRSAANTYKSDYPDLQTEAVMEYYEGCVDYFETNMANMVLDNKKIYHSLNNWTYDAKTFGWDQIYNVSTNFKSAWNTFVKKYKNDYNGATMFESYNDYISSGKAQKV